MTHEEIGICAGELRRVTFIETAKLAAAIGVKCIIETGTWRGINADGQSTRILAALAKELSADFYSVDNNADHISKSKSMMLELGIDNVRHSHSDSVLFLSLFQSPVQLLYLDSYDFSQSCPLPSQIHQVAELGAAWGKLGEKSIILLDDCNIEAGGKGLLSSQFLQERGYKLHIKSYQNLLINF